MDEVEGGIAAHRRERAVGGGAFIPREAAAGRCPQCIVEVEVLAVHIDVDVLVQVAVVGAEQEVVDAAVRHELLTGYVPAKREGGRECLAMAFWQTG